ncbi:MAG: 2-phosphosulfolactate phosphatase [Eubacteriales bacterium]|nr:2-phosphosulfolactate phosphatase [Eubacteriales bacterium]
MNIRILKTIEGAKEAEGLTVIIDVFRAFSLECYLFAAGARRIYPVGDPEEARALASAHTDCILVGEEGDVKSPGCSYGDSPWQTGAGEVAGRHYDGRPDVFTADNILAGLAVGPEGPFIPRRHKGFDGTPGCAAVPGLFSEKDFIHLTGTGSSGILEAEAAGADEIIGASLVNAEAVAKYILARNPRSVSLVAMGKDGLENAKEDSLCAKYIESLLTGSAIMGEDALPRIFRTKIFSSDQIQLIADALLTDGGEAFFNPDPEWQEVYPREDFFLSTACDLFDFVIRISRDEKGILYAEPVSPAERSPGFFQHPAGTPYP